MFSTTSLCISCLFVDMRMTRANISQVIMISHICDHRHIGLNQLIRDMTRRTSPHTVHNEAAVWERADNKRDKERKDRKTKGPYLFCCYCCNSVLEAPESRFQLRFLCMSSGLLTRCQLWRGFSNSSTFFIPEVIYFVQIFLSFEFKTYPCNIRRNRILIYNLANHCRPFSRLEPL